MKWFPSTRRQLHQEIVFTFTAIGFLFCFGQVQEASAQSHPNQIRIRTNSFTCSLHRSGDGTLIAKADANGTIIWSPDIIRKKDTRLEVRGLHFLPSEIQIKRRVHLGNFLLSALEGGVLGMAVDDFVNETGSTSFGDYAGSTGIGAGAAGLLSLFSNRNYVVAPQSKNIEVQLLHDPAFMDEQWSIAKNSNSVTRVESFQKAYPEFPNQTQVDELLLELKFDAVQASLETKAKKLAKQPNEVNLWKIKVWESHMKNFDSLLEEYHGLSTISSYQEKVTKIRREGAAIHSALMGPTPLQDLLVDVKQTPTSAGDFWRIAGWLSEWKTASPETRRQSLQTLTTVPSPWAENILRDAFVSEAGGTALIEDWSEGLGELEISTEAYLAYMKAFRRDVMTTAHSVDDAHWPNDAGFTSLVESAWSNVILHWELPESVRQDMVTACWAAIQSEEDLNATQLRDDWTGYLIPAERAELADVFSFSDTAILLADLNQKIPVDNVVVLQQLPESYLPENSTFPSIFSALQEDTLAWIIAGDSLQSRNGLILGFKSGSMAHVSVHMKPEEKDGSQSHEWDGTYRGRQSSFPMRSQDGSVMVLAGNTVNVPASDFTLILSGSNLDMTQSSDGGETKYSGNCAIQKEEDYIQFDCSAANSDNTSTPSFSLTFSRLTGQLNLTSESMGPSFSLSNPEFIGIQPPQAQEVWELRNANGVPISQLCTDWRDFSPSDGFLPRRRRNELRINGPSNGLKLPLLADINTLLEKAQNHNGWKENTDLGIRDSHHDLEDLLDQVGSALDDLDEYAEIGINLPVSISLIRLQKSRKSWQRLSNRFEKIRRDIRKKEQEEYEAEQKRLEKESLCYEWTHQSKLDEYMRKLGWSYQITAQGGYGSCGFQFIGVVITDRGGSTFSVITALLNGEVIIADAIID